MVWATKGKILRYFRLRYGFILLSENSNGIIKQIRDLLDGEKLELDKDEEPESRIIEIEDLLSNLEQKGIIVRVPSLKDDFDGSKDPSFIRLANAFSKMHNEPCLCITNQSNQNIKLEDAGSKVISYSHFRDFERFGKSSNVLQKGQNTADMLKHILKYHRFNSYPVGSLNIVDHFVYKIEDYDKSEEKRAVEKINA